MATIEDLNTSITELSSDDLYSLIRKIREQRRKKPTKKQRAKKPAKVKRRPSKKKPKQQDLFALAKGMTKAQKEKLLKNLLESM